MDVYYFTGTGNSLAAARSLAGKLGGRPIPVARAVLAPAVELGPEGAVLVFPSYLAALIGYPLILEDFLRKIEGLPAKRLFAVCDCGGYPLVNALPSLFKLEGFVRSLGGKLAGRYSVRLPMNNLDYAHIPVPIDPDPGRVIDRGDRTLARIAERIARKRSEGWKLAKRAINWILSPMYSLMAKASADAMRAYAKEGAEGTRGLRDILYGSDASIVVDDACNGCGTCAKVCPVRNIEMIRGKPAWRQRCEMCFACDEWCPRGAIRHWGRKDGVKYRHPGVSLKEMLEQSGRP